jgi:beta-lactamase class A
MIGRAGAFLLALAALPLQPLAAQVAPLQAPYAAAIGEAAKVEAGKAGIAVIDLKTGQNFSINGSERFPMASVVKLAVAAAYLAEVDAGRRTLGKMISLNERDRVGSDGIARLMPRPGVTLSAANLIELMLRVSDNTATDMLIADLGGTAAVQRWLDRNKVAGWRIDRTIARLVLDNLGLAMLPGKTAAESLWASDEPTYEAKQMVAPAFTADLRDTATPDATARFLARLDRSEMLSPASRDFLFDVMARCETGNDRLKAGLPEGAKLAHKTGTLTNISNDVGIIELADGRRYAVAVYTKGIEDGRIRARIAADTARALAAH